MGSAKSSCLDNLPVTYKSGAQLKTVTAVPEPAGLYLGVDPSERRCLD